MYTEKTFEEFEKLTADGQLDHMLELFLTEDNSLDYISRKLNWDDKNAKIGKRLSMVLRKLKDDKFLHDNKQFTVKTTYGTEMNINPFYLTFDGEIFIKKGGYT